MRSYGIKMIKVHCDGALHEFSEGIKAGEVFRNLHGKKNNAIAALVNGEEKDLSFTLNENC